REKTPEKKIHRKKPYSLEKIKEVLDKANHEDKNKLVAEWPNICQKVEEQGKSSLRALLHGSNPIAASESKVLIRSEERRVGIESEEWWWRETEKGAGR